jgi:hypothetical protein
MATTKQARKSGSATKVKGKGAKAPGGSQRPQTAARKNRSDASSTPRDSKHRGVGTPAAKRDATTSGRAGPHEPNAGGVTFRDGSKGSTIVSLLKLKNGATIAELTKATGWQAHSVRGFLSGALKKKAGLTIASEKGDDGERRYCIAP